MLEQGLIYRPIKRVIIGHIASAASCRILKGLLKFSGIVTHAIERVPRKRVRDKLELRLIHGSSLLVVLSLWCRQRI